MWIRLLLGVLVGPFLALESSSAAVTLGIDTLAAQGYPILTGKRVGLVTNPSGVNAAGVRTSQILAGQKSFRLVALFAPEHGVDGKVAAGRYVDSHRDARTGIWVHSLYGKTRKPTPEMLRGIEVLVYDMQDVGCRSYTFISTLGLVMEAASEAGIPVVVLDRPNPLGGLRVEGPGVDPSWKSFVAQYDIPYVYGLTVGELAWWINDKWLPHPCNLHVFKMGGWNRSMVWADTGLTWVPTSPNIPSSGSTWGYAATGLVGDLGVSNGANVTPIPFEVVASENVDAGRMAALLNGLGLAGVRFEPYSFRPPSGPYSRVTYSGVRLRVDPRTAETLVGLNFYLLDVLRTLQPSKKFTARLQEDGRAMFDKINGGPANRKRWVRGAGAADVRRSWAGTEAQWKRDRLPYLMYP
ncbi:MAG: DUF1343 domain-containing protein [Candidatus Methylacidiphilales bacterium]|nr:DUF1343 domain-containing protein [Candidatus Methylacidiphilales bacterium]